MNFLSLIKKNKKNKKCKRLLLIYSVLPVFCTIVDLIGLNIKYTIYSAGIRNKNKTKLE